MKFAYTCHFQQIGINATKVEKTGIHFKTDVFAAVAVFDAKAPYLICLREEGMMQSFHRSHAKKPESGLFSDWIGNNTDDLRYSD